MGHDSEEETSNLLDFAAKAARKLFLGEAQRDRCACAYDIHYRLGLGEVHLAAEKCPLRELAGFRRTSSRPQDGLEEPRNDEHATMAVKFCHIFSCVAVWRAKDDRHALIQLALPIAETAKVQLALLKGVRSALCREKTLCNRRGKRSGDSDDGDRAFAGRR